MRRAERLVRHLQKEPCSNLDDVEASLQYSHQDDETSDEPVQLAQTDSGITTSMTVRNGRGRGHTLHEHGFQLSSLRFDGLRDRQDELYDPFQMQSRMYPKAEEVIKRCVPESSRVLVFDHLIRDPVRYQKETTNTEMPSTPLLCAGPVRSVHGDYTVRSGYMRARQLLAPHETPERIDAALKQHFTFLNVWVPLESVKKDPLGLIEWKSQRPSDVRTVRMIFKHRVGELYRVVPSESHRWVYFPSMQPGECLVFKVFDSATDGRARFSLHAAFQDPNADPSAPERRSVELRCIVFTGDLPENFASSFIAPHLCEGSPDQELAPERTEILPVSESW